ncbi:MAG: thiaminase II [Candidatus Rokubacteria bacterium]|nr:thiaminase II [Candidatus Rokubacteria bacterium]
MGLSDDLRKRAEPVWTRSLAHPFVLGIGAGSLPVDRFRFYIRQDYVFLIEYARVLALACAKARDLPDMEKLAELLHATLGREMTLHRAYCGEFGITPEELERTEPAPTTYAYTRHLLDTAWSGSLAEIVASLFPCQWSYWEIGTMLATRGAPRHAPLYCQWIDTYASKEYGELAQWVKTLLDRLGADASTGEREPMTERFLLSSRFEHAFWEMAWTMEQWSPRT